MTYSIVARDPETSAFGVAVQSHYFSVGSAVPWARPGAGAVATQSMVELSYGPRGLDLMASGVPASEALARLLERDAGRESRQVAFVDGQGRVAAHTGADCIVHAGHVAGDQVSCQANLMASAEIWDAMLAAYEAASAAGEPVAYRLLAAMDAAEALGGDVRGRQSAAILIVPGSGSEEVWRRTLDLRVEDHPDPLVEMRRLLGIQRAYALAGQADEALVAGEAAVAGRRFSEALDQLPDSHELKFWAGVSLVHSGDPERGLPLVSEAIAAQPGWAWLLPRLRDEQVPGAVAVTRDLGLTPSS